jgi:hypothetical protein
MDAVADLENALLDEVRGLLADWRRRYEGRPDEEREQLWLLALEREQIVAVAYREKAVAGRVSALPISDSARALLRQTLVWIWNDDERHAFPPSPAPNLPTRAVRPSAQREFGLGVPAS